MAKSYSNKSVGHQAEDFMWVCVNVSEDVCVSGCVV